MISRSLWALLRVKGGAVYYTRASGMYSHRCVSSSISVQTVRALALRVTQIPGLPGGRKPWGFPDKAGKIPLEDKTRQSLFVPRARPSPGPASLNRVSRAPCYAFHAPPRDLPPAITQQFQAPTSPDPALRLVQRFPVSFPDTGFAVPLSSVGTESTPRPGSPTCTVLIRGHSLSQAPPPRTDPKRADPQSAPRRVEPGRRRVSRVGQS